MISYSSSAPTGSGKTVLFELAIIRMLTEARGSESLKCVYIAPTKVISVFVFPDLFKLLCALGIMLRKI